MKLQCCESGRKIVSQCLLELFVQKLSLTRVDETTDEVPIL